MKLYFDIILMIIIHLNHNILHATSVLLPFASKIMAHTDHYLNWKQNYFMRLSSFELIKAPALVDIEWGKEEAFAE